MTCHGNSPESPCCWVNGELCIFLTDHPTRKGACSLFIELGDWNLVHTDPRYVETVLPEWIKAGVPNCGDWVGPGCCYGPDWTPEAELAYQTAAERPGTPVHVRRARGLIPDEETETVTEPPPIPRSQKQRMALGQRPKP